MASVDPSFDPDHVAAPDEANVQALPAGPQRLARRDFLAGAGSVLALVALAGCGGGSGSSGGNSSSTGPLTGTVPTQSAAGTVNTAQIGGTGLTVGSAYQQRAALGASGAFTTTVSAQGAQLLTVMDAAGQIRALGTSVPGSPLTLDATSTAVTLLYMTPGIVSIDLNEAASRLTALQALAPFAALTAFLARNLPTTSLSALAKGGQLALLKQACVTAYLTKYPAAIRSARQTRVADDPLGEVTVAAGVKGTSGTPLNFNNSGWRYVSVYRQFLDANDKELAPYHEAFLQGTANPTLDPGLLPGANPVSLGSIFTNQIGSAGSGQENLDLTTPAGLVKVRYWVIGPGLGPIQNPLPLSMPESALSTQSYGTTVFYYAFLPLADFVIGAVTSLKKGLDAMAVLWVQISKGINIGNLFPAFMSGSAGNVEVALVDAIIGMATAGLTIYQALGLTTRAAEIASAVLGPLAFLFDGANVAVALANFLLHPRESAVTFQVQTTTYKITPIKIQNVPVSPTMLINNNGQVAGNDEFKGAFFYDSGKVTYVRDVLGLPPGTGLVYTGGLNNKGQLAGWIEYAEPNVGGTGGDFDGFVYDSGSGKATLLGKQNYLIVSGITDSGVICGRKGWGPDSVGFLLSNGVFTPLVPPDGQLFTPAAINASGQVLGRHDTEGLSGSYKICLYSNGTFTDLVTMLQNSGGQAEAINASGQALYSTGVIGDAGTAGVIYSKGVSTPIAFPGHDGTAPSAINTNGQVVGTADNGGFLYSEGTYKDLNTLIADSGWTLPFASGINDTGQICGFGVSPDGQSSVPLLLTPA